METDRPLYEISCSWNPSTDDLRKCILVEPSDADALKSGNDVVDSGPLEHAISEENYVKFERRINSDLPFTLTLTFKNPRCRMTKLSVASEARIIELYGKHGEYLSTHVCDLLHEDDEYGLFHHSQPEVSSFQEITVKFICRKTSLWVYGLKIIFTVELPSETPSQFNLKVIEDLLQGSSRPLSDKAEKARKFLEMYSKVVRSPHTLASNGGQPPPVEQTESAYHQVVNGEVMLNQDGHSPKSDNNASAESVRELKNYVDVCVSEVERRVTESVNEKLSQMEAKQDEKLSEIIRMLQSKP